MAPCSRRDFCKQAATAAAAGAVWPKLVDQVGSRLEADATSTFRPNIAFPIEPRERIAIASYPFRNFISGSPDQDTHAAAQKIDFKDFAAHVSEKLNIKKIEPWSRHFRSTDAKYLEEFRTAMANAKGAVVNVAVDGRHSIYAADSTEREMAIAFSKQWIDVAAAVGSPGIRTNIAQARDSKPDVERAAASLQQMAEYGATKNVVVNLENDNPVTEDPFFLVKLIDRVNSPWLRANPDFCNSLTAFPADYAYRGIEAMFQKGYSICHVKAMEANERTGEMFHVDLPRTFAILKRANYRGYCSMEFDSPGDPYAGTAELIQQTLIYLA
jgi:sugar phosphate isomerase/epimerase